MGKRDKKHKHQKQQRGARRGGASRCYTEEGEGEGEVYFDEPLYNLQHSFSLSNDDDDDIQEEEGTLGLGKGEEEAENDPNLSKDFPSKFLLYQQSVQSPRGDISYLQKFFLMYVGGRQPLHLQEDFCGTALLSTEWLHTDPRRTAVGLDLDLEALEWCLNNNINKLGCDGYSRLYLFHGNVLHPHEAKIVQSYPQVLIQKIGLGDNNSSSVAIAMESTEQQSVTASGDDKCMKKSFGLSARDIVCAFNYSCCCLHRRVDLVSYFKHVLDALSKKGGIFVMDLYGGTSAECKLRLQRRFANFTYVWEQAEFDVIERKTRISLHYHFLKQQKKLRHAFSYSWRLWSLPEINDCLEEAGFSSVHFWLREMPDTEEIRSMEGFGVERGIKYEEFKSFEQRDAWNAYIVGVT